MRWRIVALVSFVTAWTVCIPRMVRAEDKKMPATELRVQAPADIKWQDAPASLPPGAKLAVLEGNPAKEGTFVMRLKLPDGYRVPPHTHPKPEIVTVISGIFRLGSGKMVRRFWAFAPPLAATAAEGLPRDLACSHVT